LEDDAEEESQSDTNGPGDQAVQDPQVDFLGRDADEGQADGNSDGGSGE
jgi:hypothetical protein